MCTKNATALYVVLVATAAFAFPRNMQQSIPFATNPRFFGPPAEAEAAAAGAAAAAAVDLDDGVFKIPLNVPPLENTTNKIWHRTSTPVTVPWLDAVDHSVATGLNSNNSTSKIVPVIRHDGFQHPQGQNILHWFLQSEPYNLDLSTKEQRSIVNGHRATCYGDHMPVTSCGVKHQHEFRMSVCDNNTCMNKSDSVKAIETVCLNITHLLHLDSGTKEKSSVGKGHRSTFYGGHTSYRVKDRNEFRNDTRDHNTVPFGHRLVALDRSKDQCHHQEKNASGVHTLLRPTTGTPPAPDHAATRTLSDLLSELGSTVVVVSGGETTSLFARHRRQRRNKQQQRQHRQPPQQQQSPQQACYSAAHKVNHCVFILFGFVLLVVWVFVICVPGKKMKQKKKQKKIWSSETRSTHNFAFLIPVLFLCVFPVHSIVEASSALAMKQMDQAHSAQVELVAAAVAPSSPSSDTFGHYGVDKILCVGPGFEIEDVMQWACAYVKKRGYERIGEGAVLL